YSTIRFADVNGDNRADVCGRGSGGLHCAMNLGGTFGAAGLVIPNFSDIGGWDQPQYYRTIQLADLNGDHRADVCGRGTAGMWCATSIGASFNPLSLWVANFSDAAGWNAGPFYYSTIRLTDVTGDGRADVCGRGSGGIHCAASTGGSFGAVNLWTPSFRDADGWKAPEYYSTIRFP
ncbi:MAG: FG-GAP repeat domain-containing protein, partial [Solirubrobacteraceae bacterium]